jgi:esterase/lipase superfamily enzyme
VPITDVIELSARAVPTHGETKVYWVPLSIRGASDVTILIHGFNNSRDVAEKSFRRFLRTFVRSGLVGRLCVFYWPGDHGVLRYYQEIARAKASAQILFDYLAIVAAASPSKRVNVSLICHSLGNRLALELVEISREYTGVRFARAVLMAPAVPLNFAAPRGLLYKAAKAIEHTEVFYSHSDEALGAAFVGGQLLAREPATGAVGKSGGPPNVWTRTSDFTPYGHSDYWAEPESALTAQTVFGVATVRYLPRRSRLQRWLAPLSRLPRREMPERALFPYQAS